MNTREQITGPNMNRLIEGPDAVQQREQLNKLIGKLLVAFAIGLASGFVFGAICAVGGR